MRETQINVCYWGKSGHASDITECRRVTTAEYGQRIRRFFFRFFRARGSSAIAVAELSDAAGKPAPAS
jgi:hypothetical protein